MPTVEIDPLSVTSLYLKLYGNGKQLLTATGFVVERDGRRFLVSNWHVFSGRNADTGAPLDTKTAALPDQVRIALHVSEADPSKGAKWVFFREQLCEADGTPRWIEHPRGREVDVAALELSLLAPAVKPYPLPLELAAVKLTIRPAMPISVIGFPLGLRPNVFFAVWVTGHVASDFDLDYRERPAFLIDAATTKGMSGSPVFARSEGDFWGERIFAPGRVFTRFLGVYSGRLDERINIGQVWRPSAIAEVLDRAVQKPFGGTVGGIVEGEPAI